MSIAHRAGNALGGFFVGAGACFVFAAVDLLRLKGDYLSQLPLNYAANQFADELWSNWPLALAIGALGAIVCFVATFRRRS